MEAQALNVRDMPQVICKSVKKMRQAHPLKWGDTKMRIAPPIRWQSCEIVRITALLTRGSR